MQLSVIGWGSTRGRFRFREPVKRTASLKWCNSASKPSAPLERPRKLPKRKTCLRRIRLTQASVRGRWFSTFMTTTQSFMRRCMARLKSLNEAVSGVGIFLKRDIERAIAAGASVVQPSIPQRAIDKLKANPAMRSAFDNKYGAGSSAKILGGGSGTLPVAFQPQGLPGERVTSTLRSPARNKAVGGVANSFHLTGQARDSLPRRACPWRVRLAASPVEPWHGCYQRGRSRPHGAKG